MAPEPYDGAAPGCRLRQPCERSRADQGGERSRGECVRRALADGPAGGQPRRAGADQELPRDGACRCLAALHQHPRGGLAGGAGAVVPRPPWHGPVPALFADEPPAVPHGLPGSGQHHPWQAGRRHQGERTDRTAAGVVRCGAEEEYTPLPPHNYFCIELTPHLWSLLFPKSYHHKKRTPLICGVLVLRQRLCKLRSLLPQGISGDVCGALPSAPGRGEPCGHAC